MAVLTVVKTIEEFVANNEVHLEAWKQMKEEIAKETKTVKENECALATLEQNMGKEYESQLADMKWTLDSAKEELSSKLEQFNTKSADINVFKENCASMIKLLLRSYDRLNKQFFSSLDGDMGEQPCDPIAVEAAKTFWSDIDNHQLRSDPPISGLYKDELRKNKDVVDGNVTASNA
jgi:hypothetical protein